MKKLFSIMLCVLMAAAFIAGCGGNTGETDKFPKSLKSGEAVSLDLYGTFTKDVKISDYIDENGAEEVEYEATAGNANVLLNAISNGTFTITGSVVGTSTVTLTAAVEGEVKVTITWAVTVVDTTPVSTTAPKKTCGRRQYRP